MLPVSSLKLLNNIIAISMIGCGAIESYSLHRKKGEFSDKDKYKKSQIVVGTKALVRAGTVYCMEYSFKILDGIISNI